MIHHIEVYVSELSKTKRFYSRLFSLINYSVYQEWDQGISFKNADSYIVFVQVEDAFKVNGYHRKNIGLNHLAFTVKDNIEVDIIRESLKQNGVVELYSEKYPYAGGEDYYAFFFEDPDRIKLEIVAEQII